MRKLTNNLKKFKSQKQFCCKRQGVIIECQFKGLLSTPQKLFYLTQDKD
jgi:hypothetical protein